MQTTLDFLKAIWDETQNNNYYCIVTIRHKVVSHHYFTDIKLAASAATVFSEEGFDVYYCISTLTHKHRVQNNAVSFKELAFDMDAKSNSKCYPDITSCKKHLYDFCDKLKIPYPTILLTGGGLHCHWIFNSSIDRATYFILTESLRLAAKRFNFKLDSSTVGNAVQILRLLDTFNYKREKPFRITLLNEQPFIDVIMLRPLCNLFEENKISYQYDDSLVSKADASISLILKKGCLAFRQLEKDGMANNSEPAWLGVISNGVLCEGGEEWLHKNSAKFEGYSYDETQRKIDNTKRFINQRGGGPSRCVTIAQHYPDCALCPHLHTTSAPVQLGREPTKIAQQTLLSEEDDMIFHNGVRMITAPIKIVAIDNIEGSDEKEARVLTPSGVFHCNPNDLHKLEVMDDHLSRRRIGIENVDSKTFEKEMRPKRNEAYRKEYGTVAATMGWNQDYTMLKHGHYQINKDGILLVPPRSDIQVPVLEMRPMGAASNELWHTNPAWIAEGLERQKAVLQPFFDPGFENQGCVIIASMAGLFWSVHERDQGGLIISLYGEQSGTGKTTALQAGLSLHGPWQSFMLRSNSSMLEHQEKLALFRHYPLGIDEAYIRNPELFIEYMRIFTTGRPKDRLDRSGRIRYRNERWGTTLFLTSNRSALSYLQAKIDATAMAERLIEIRFVELPVEHVNNQLIKSINETAGFITPVFISNILKHNLIPSIQKRVQQLIEKYNSKKTFEHRHRYKIAHLALCETVAELLVDYDIFSFDINNFINYYEQLIHISSENIIKYDCVNVMNGLMQDYRDRIWTELYTTMSAGRPSIARLEPAEGGCWICVKFLNEQCIKAGINLKELLYDLKQRGRIDKLVPTPKQLEGNMDRGFSLTVDAIFYKMDISEIRLVELKIKEKSNEN